MEIACGLSRIKREHSYSDTIQMNPHCMIPPENPELFHPIDDDKKTIQIKEEVLCADDPEDGLGFEFIDVGNLNTLKKRLEAKIAAWDKKTSKSAWDPLNGNLLPPSREVLACEEKYEKRIRSLQRLIESIINVASQEVEKSSVQYLQQKVKNLETRLEQTFATQLSRNEFRQQVKERYSAKSKVLSAQVEALQNDKKKLFLQLKKARQERNEKPQVNNEETFIQVQKFVNLQVQLYAKEQQIGHLQSLLHSADGEKEELRSCIEDMKYKLATNEAKCRDLEEKCSLLTRELESSTKKYMTQATELAKERLDSDFLKTWLRDSLESRHVFKEQLAELNEDIRKRTNNLRCKAKVLQQKLRKENVEESYLNDPDNLLEHQDRKWREIMREFYVLRESVSILKYNLSQKTKHCSFLEQQCEILRGQVQANKTVEVKGEGAGKKEEVSVGEILINTCD